MTKTLLLENGNEPKYKAFTKCDIPNMSIKRWLKTKKLLKFHTWNVSIIND